jgi:diaminopimelate decarboxylase
LRCAVGPGSLGADYLTAVVDHGLPPVVHPDVAGLAGSTAGELRRLAGEGGTPFHLFFPDVMLGTIGRFRRVMDDAGNADGRIYFAVKANDANSPVAVAAAAGIGVDVSSAEEFALALGRGVPGTDISVSGPAKPAGLLCLAAKQGALIQIDQPHELEELAVVAARLGAGLVRVSFRLHVAGSRFGMLLPEVRAVMERVVSLGPAVRLEGVAFHCPGYESLDRVAMIGKACGVVAEAAGLGMAPRRVSIGGGLAVQYADPDGWDARRATEREFVGGKWAGRLYPYTACPAGPEQLEQILRDSRKTLAAALPSGMPVAVDVEPGRSMLDQAGLTVFRVLEVRPYQDRWVVVVDGNSTYLREAVSGEYLVDPVLVTDAPPAAEPFCAAIAAATCLERDWLASRFVPFARRPQRGDLLVYYNTAGYLHCRAARFHRVELPRTLAAWRVGAGWRFKDDGGVGVADVIGVGS